MKEKQQHSKETEIAPGKEYELDETELEQVSGGNIFAAIQKVTQLKQRAAHKGQNDDDLNKFIAQ